MKKGGVIRACSLVLAGPWSGGWSLIKVLVVCGGVGEEPVGEEPLLPPRIAAHVQAQPIMVPDVEDAVAGSPVLVGFPLDGVVLHRSDARQPEASVEEAGQPLGPHLRRVDVGDALRVAEDRQLRDPRVDGVSVQRKGS